MSESVSTLEPAQDLLGRYHAKFQKEQPSVLTMGEYLDLCRKDRSAYASPAERMLEAIGQPRMVDTRTDDRLSRIHGSKVIPVYDSFAGFYGMEGVIEDIVSYFRKAAQNLEESRQVLYLLGPVGSAKSSLAKHVMRMAQQQPFYRLQGSPVNDNPLALFDPVEWGEELERDHKIPRRHLENTVMSPWAAKRLQEYGGDLTQFKIERVYPSITRQIAIARVEPGDENNQDVSTLVGSVDIRKLEQYAQNDPDAYAYSGGLCLANRGMLEFVEMFKAPIKVLHPLLTATQEGQYKGTEAIGALPFSGLVMAHSNESEWTGFKNNKNNEAFLDRVYTVKVPYTLRWADERKIYEKMLRESDLSGAPCAPETLDIMAQFSVLSRLKEPENSSLYSKMRVYNGENLKDVDPKAKSLQEYEDHAGEDEGMEGLSTRWAFKTLSSVFNMAGKGVGNTEVEANPVHLFQVLKDRIRTEQYEPEREAKYLGYIDEYLLPGYAKRLGAEIQRAYVESYSEYGQNIFDQYIDTADAWIQNKEMRDSNTGEIYDPKALDDKLKEIEKPAGVSNPKDFRNEVVNFCLRYRASHGGHNPDWTEYEKLKLVIEKKMFEKTDDLLPVISFNKKADKKEEEKHENYVSNMVRRGYSPKQVRLVTEWYLRVKDKMKP